MQNNTKHKTQNTKQLVVSSRKSVVGEARILFIGDIVGKPGRRAVAEILPGLKKKEKIDLVIANGENMSHGRGISLNHYEAMRQVGIDWFTTGNHIWSRQDIVPYLNDPSIQILRPANYEGTVPGRGSATIKLGAGIIHLINLQGRVFMPEATGNPFLIFDDFAKKLTDPIIVDLHAEATSEKNAFAHYVTDRATAVFGTHTHIQTADECILGKGTAYITDVGMTGSTDSLLGAEPSSIISHFLTGLPWKYEVAEDRPVEFDAVLVAVNQKTNRASSIKRIRIINSK